MIAPAIWFALSALSALCSAEIVVREFEVPRKRFGQMYSFGFLPGGTVDVQLESSDGVAPLAFFICHKKEHVQMKYICSALQSNHTLNCDIVQVFSRSLRTKYQFSSYGMYYFDLANCNDVVIRNLTFRATAVNPGEQQLSASLIPLPRVLALSLALWCAAFLLGLVSLLTGSKYGRGARMLLLLIAASKIVALVAARADVLSRSQHGVVDQSIERVADISQGVMHAFGLSSAVALSNGWLLLRRWPQRPTSLLLLFAALIATAVLKNKLGSGLSEVLVEFVSLGLVIMSCLWSMRNVNFNLYRFHTWVPSTVRQRVPGAASESESYSTSASSDDSDSDIVAGRVRRRRRVAPMEYVEVNPQERHAIVYRTAVFTALRRALVMMIGGAGLVMCASLMLSQSVDTWMLQLITEAWLLIVVCETWVTFQLITTNIFEIANNNNNNNDNNNDDDDDDSVDNRIGFETSSSSSSSSSSSL